MFAILKVPFAMSEKLTVTEAQLKLEYYCPYKERCLQKVVYMIWATNQMR